MQNNSKISIALCDKVPLDVLPSLIKVTCLILQFN